MKLLFKCPYCERQTELEVKKITKKVIKNKVFHHLQGMKCHIGRMHKGKPRYEFPDIIIK